MGRAGERAIAGGARAGDLSAAPNLVSLARIALLPVALLLIAAGERVGAAAVVILIAVSDGLDGYVARRTGRETELGRILDPLADKIALNGVLVALSLRGEFPVWAAALVVARDVGIAVGAVLVIRRTATVPQAALVGKVALVLLSVMAAAYAADLRAAEPWVLTAGIAGVVASSVGYAAALARALRERQHAAAPRRV